MRSIKIQRRCIKTWHKTYNPKDIIDIIKRLIVFKNITLKLNPIKSNAYEMKILNNH